MTTHTPTSKRLNTGQLGVCVRGWAALSGKTDFRPWYAKRYRRAMMRGPGVYVLGLWGVVSGRAKRVWATINNKALFPMPIKEIDLFEALLKEMEEDTSLRQAVIEKLRKLENDEIVNKRKKRSSKREYRQRIRPSKYIKDLMEYRNSLYFIQERSGFGHFWNTSISRYISLIKNRIIKTFLRKIRGIRIKLLSLILLTRLLKRADRYRAFLSRIVKTRKRPARIPRPIHTRPRPPAAPLAPPAIA